MHRLQPHVRQVAESSLREYVRYARCAHRGGSAARRETPILYMNGLDVFEQHAGLWDDSVDQLPGSIDNLTRQTYTQASRLVREGGR